MEDSRNALFVEPGAYIQRVEKKNSPNKVIFQEPYENMPNYYMNNGITKHERKCDCCVDDKVVNKPHAPTFDIKSLMPLLGTLGGSSGLGGLSNLLSSLSGGGGIKDMISSVVSNPEILKTVIGFMTKNKTTTSNKHEIQKSDLEIKNYTKVE